MASPARKRCDVAAVPAPPCARAPSGTRTRPSLNARTRSSGRTQRPGQNEVSRVTAAKREQTDGEWKPALPVGLTRAARPRPPDVIKAPLRKNAASTVHGVAPAKQPVVRPTGTELAEAHCPVEVGINFETLAVSQDQVSTSLSLGCFNLRLWPLACDAFDDVRLNVLDCFDNEVDDLDTSPFPLLSGNFSLTISLGDELVEVWDEQDEQFDEMPASFEMLSIELVTQQEFLLRPEAAVETVDARDDNHDDILSSVMPIADSIVQASCIDELLEAAQYSIVVEDESSQTFFPALHAAVTLVAADDDQFAQAQSKEPATDQSYQKEGPKEAEKAAPRIGAAQGFSEAQAAFDSQHFDHQKSAGEKDHMNDFAVPACQRRSEECGPAGQPGSRTLSASKSQRRIIGGVVRAASKPSLDGRRSSAAGPDMPSADSRRRGASIPKQTKREASIYRLDSDEPELCGASHHSARGSSLTRGYDILGVQFFSLHDDVEKQSEDDFGATVDLRTTKAVLCPVGARLARVHSASALALDLGQGAVGMSSFLKSISAHGPATPVRSSSASSLQVVKAKQSLSSLPTLPTKQGTVPGFATATCSGSLAWSRRLSRTGPQSSGAAPTF